MYSRKAKFHHIVSRKMLYKKQTRNRMKEKQPICIKNVFLWAMHPRWCELVSFKVSGYTIVSEIMQTIQRIKLRFLCKLVISVPPDSSFIFAQYISRYRILLSCRAAYISDRPHFFFLFGGINLPRKPSERKSVNNNTSFMRQRIDPKRILILILEKGVKEGDKSKAWLTRIVGRQTVRSYMKL